MKGLQGKSGWWARRAIRVLTAACLVGLGMLPVSIKGQTLLTEAQAEKVAETLLGRKPDHTDSYFSKQEDLQYFAFTISRGSRWNAATQTQLPPREQIWIYERKVGSNVLRLLWATRQLWKDFSPTNAYGPPQGFVQPPRETRPCLRFSDIASGNEAGTTRLGLYCVGEKRLFWVDYFSEFGQSIETGVRKVGITESAKAFDPPILYLLSWGHELHLDTRESRLSRAMALVQQ